MNRKTMLTVGALVLLLLPTKGVQILAEPLGFLPSAALAYLWMIAALLL